MLKLKVCGMRGAKNIQDLQVVMPDFIGFIFYPLSPRYINNKKGLEFIDAYTSQTKKVGVFVNASVSDIKDKITEYHLDYVQIYEKDISFCKKLQEENIKIILAISVETGIEFEHLEIFSGMVVLFVI